MEGKSPMMVEALFNESSEQIIIFNRLGNLEFINKKAEETLKSVHLLSNFWSNTDKNNSEWERFIRTVIENSTSSTTLFLVNKYHQKMPIKIWGYYLQQKQLIFTRIQLNPSNVISFEEKNDMIVFQNLINGMAQGVILTMLDGKILSVNEMALHLLDRKPAQIENRSYDYLFEDCHYESSVIVQYYKKISNREMASLFVKKETADGKTVYLNFISKVDENLGLLVTTIIDQTEEMILLKKIEHQQSLSFIGQNIASIAHEIRNPMTSIQGFIQMIKSSLNEEQNPYFQIVESELKRMDDLLVDLLSIAKPKKQVFKSLDMKVLVDEAIQLMQPTAMTTDAMIVFEYDEEIEYTMMGDYSRLKQMVINILKNAIESVECNNYIVVKLLYSKDSSIKLSIKDSGKGMDSLDLENALNPFFTTKEYGSGLGLLLVQSVIKEHDAILHIESEVGVGSNFIIEFNPQSNREFMNPIHAYKIGESRISANMK
ncbi:ATP-binding protein [Solibacillus sp. FSL W8-0474]|uniref:ATP-binding protein n=1 Tax=Solibacillus sp. FSL W8-0474 TaxID=2975336 RepID=UPI0030F566CE